MRRFPSGNVLVEKYVRVVRDGRIVVHHPGDRISLAEAIDLDLVSRGEVPEVDLYPRPARSELPTRWERNG